MRAAAVVWFRRADVLRFYRRVAVAMPVGVVTMMMAVLFIVISGFFAEFFFAVAFFVTFFVHVHTP